MSHATSKGAGRRRGRTIISAQAVYQCYVDLATANPPRPGTRKDVAAELGVPYTLIDEHTDRLLEKGLLRRVVPGVFEPVHIRANRAITITALPTGGAKLEVGDQVLDLQTAWEASYARNLLDGLLKSARLGRHGEKTIPET